MRKTRVFWGIAALILITTACFHGRHTTSVIGYRNQMVFLHKDQFYKVGELPPDWSVLKTHAKAAAFHNEKLGATVSTDAFCAGGFEDLPLKTLTAQLFAGTASTRNIIKERPFDLDGRGALRTISTGNVDGVPLKFDAVVLKKNNCTIDFVYISPPENYVAGVADFEAFYSGFSFN